MERNDFSKLDGWVVNALKRWHCESLKFNSDSQVISFIRDRNILTDYLMLEIFINDL